MSQNFHYLRPTTSQVKMVFMNADAKAKAKAKEEKSIFDGVKKLTEPQYQANKLWGDQRRDLYVLIPDNEFATCNTIVFKTWSKQPVDAFCEARPAHKVPQTGRKVLHVLFWNSDEGTFTDVGDREFVDQYDIRNLMASYSHRTISSVEKIWASPKTVDELIAELSEAEPDPLHEWTAEDAQRLERLRNMDRKNEEAKRHLRGIKAEAKSLVEDFHATYRRDAEWDDQVAVIDSFRHALARLYNKIGTDPDVNVAELVAETHVVLVAHMAMQAADIEDKIMGNSGLALARDHVRHMVNKMRKLEEAKAKREQEEAASA